ncbi:LptF/LptG family permease [Flavobacteriaceae bacterium]|nr:LptF/LptG family permease [Flavobacteriaceae bacterium]
MKILDKYILKTFIKTFLIVFFIIMFIFLLQSVWLYISELAGKDLDIAIIIKFLTYVSPRLVILILPLTILLSSIMVFGSFAENYEFAAMKSTGISLQRAMRSLSVFIFLIAIVTFLFSNNINPVAEYNFHNLRKNISKVKPTMAIAEGQFNQIGRINIKVKNKNGDNGQYLTDVIIHQKKNKVGNYTVIKSKTGEISSSLDSDILQLKLFDGNYYEEVTPQDFKQRDKKPHLKSYFKEYILNIDLAEINNVDFDDKEDANKYTMLSVADLDITIDSLLVKKKQDYNLISIKMHNRSNALTLNDNIKAKIVDTIFEGENFYDLFKLKKQIQLFDLAISSINSTNSILKSNKIIQAYRDKNINKHIISLHDKFAISFACIILFFIGAPLGAIIRKGGFGLPLVISIVLFLVYHFIGIFTKNLAEDSSINPILASWLSTIIMLPFSIYLTNRATKDRSIFNFSNFYRIINKFLNRSNNI